MMVQPIEQILANSTDNQKINSTKEFVTGLANSSVSILKYSTGHLATFPALAVVETLLKFLYLYMYPICFYNMSTRLY